jgi:deoxyribodipyrimidine photolyase
LELQRYGVQLGKSYPRPVVSHKEARNRYLSVVKKALDSRRAR